MTSTFTPNLDLEQPARGDDVGTWDTPVNNNMSVIDLAIGARTVVSLNNSNVTLSAAQFQSRLITFNSTLTGNVTITFPTSFIKSWDIQHACTGSSAFTITLQTTASGAAVICAPPGEIVSVTNFDGRSMVYNNLGRVGAYWDYAGSSVPAWVSGCTIAPYLNCDGSTFSATTFPALAAILGGTTLPDRRGTVGVTLNQGTGRMTNVVNASSVGVVGGADTVTLSASQIPSITGTVTVSAGGNVIPFVAPPILNQLINGGTVTNAVVSAQAWTGATSLSGTMASNNTGSGSHGNVQPTTVYGICMIRAG